MARKNIKVFYKIRIYKYLKSLLVCHVAIVMAITNENKFNNSIIYYIIIFSMALKKKYNKIK